MSQGLRAAGAARKGGTPGEGPPFDPLLRFVSIGAFRALRRAAKGSAPGPRPLFCKKAGQKTFTWLDFCQPKPLAVAASDSIRPRSGHLSGRVAAPTRVGEAGGSRNLTGAPPPHKRFSLGLHPVSLGKTKEMGWNRSTRQNQPPAKRRVPPNPKPRAGMEPSPYRRVVRFRVLICPAVNARAGRRGRRPLQGLSGNAQRLRRAARAPPLDPARFFVKKRGKKLLLG